MPQKDRFNSCANRRLTPLLQWLRMWGTGGRIGVAQTTAGRSEVSRILIAEDEPGVREVITVLLEDAGHMVQTASDGLAALKMITDDLPDLFITDVMMPRLDGWLLLNFVRERAPALPVIIISAVDPKTTRLRSE